MLHVKLSYPERLADIRVDPWYLSKCGKEYKSLLQTFWGKKKIGTDTWLSD